jgi:cysteine synthase
MESILDAIGNTPLVRVRHCAPLNGAELWLKLEYRNPTGSLKDRMALAMIEGAERDGLISQGDTVVEYTGGSTGPALALVCGAKGYQALIVMADCFTEERFQLMRALGAEIDVVPSVEGRPKVTAQDIDNMVARAAVVRDGSATQQTAGPFNVSFGLAATDGVFMTKGDRTILASISCRGPLQVQRISRGPVETPNSPRRFDGARPDPLSEIAT